VDREFIAVRVAVLLVTDVHTTKDEKTVKSIVDRLTRTGHRLREVAVVKDQAPLVRAHFERWLAEPDVDVVIAISGLETESTREALAPLITKPLDGFSELFRMLTFGEIGTGAMLTDVLAAQCSSTFVFVLPASHGAVKTALDKILLPQLDHRTKPRNLVMRMPKLRDADASALVVESSAKPSPIDEDSSAVPRPVKPEDTEVGVPPPPRRPVPPAVPRAATTPPPSIEGAAKPPDEPRPVANQPGEVVALEIVKLSSVDETAASERDPRGAAEIVALDVVKLSSVEEKPGTKPDDADARRANAAIMIDAAKAVMRDSAKLAAVKPAKDPEVAAAVPIAQRETQPTNRPPRPRTEPPPPPARALTPAIGRPIAQRETQPPDRPRRPSTKPPPPPSARNGLTPATGVGVPSTAAGEPRPNGRPATHRATEPTSSIIVDASLPSTIDRAHVAGVAEARPERPVIEAPAESVIVDGELGASTEPAPRARPQTAEVVLPVRATVVETRSLAMFDARELSAPRRRRRVRQLAYLSAGGLAFAVALYLVIDLVGTRETPRAAASAPEQPMVPAPAPPPIAEPAMTTLQPDAAELVEPEAIEPEAIEIEPTYASRKPRKPASASDPNDPPSPDNPKTDDCDEVTCILEKYARPCCAVYKPAETASTKPPPPPPKPNPLGLPEELDRSMIKAGVDQVRVAIISCGEKAGVKGTVKLAVTVDPGGRIESVAVTATPEPALGDCVAAAVRRTSFAKTLNGGSFSYPFVF
jgi:molybdenum cofactor biosynthesis protein B